MAGRMSRNKGARGEREAISILQPVADRVCEALQQPPLELRRNPSQRYKGKEYDLVGIPWLCLEIKRQENLAGMGSWWKQTLEACRPGQVPVLMYRPNHAKWKVRLKIWAVAGANGKSWETVEVVADVSLEHFLEWFESMLKIELRRDRST